MYRVFQVGAIVDGRFRNIMENSGSPIVQAMMSQSYETLEGAQNDLTDLRKKLEFQRSMVFLR